MNRNRKVDRTLARLKEEFGANCRYISIRDAAEFSGQSVPTIWKVVQRNKLETVMPEGKRLILIDSFARWLNRNEI